MKTITKIENQLRKNIEEERSLLLNSKWDRAEFYTKAKAEFKLNKDFAEWVKGVSDESLIQVNKQIMIVEKLGAQTFVLLGEDKSLSLMHKEAWTKHNDLMESLLLQADTMTVKEIKLKITQILNKPIKEKKPKVTTNDEFLKRFTALEATVNNLTKDNQDKEMEMTNLRNQLSHAQSINAIHNGTYKGTNSFFSNDPELKATQLEKLKVDADYCLKLFKVTKPVTCVAVRVALDELNKEYLHKDDALAIRSANKLIRQTFKLPTR